MMGFLDGRMDGRKGARVWEKGRCGSRVALFRINRMYGNADFLQSVLKSSRLCH